MGSVGQVILAMIGYYAGDVRRINHFMKVYGFARAIAQGEKLDDAEREILEIAALTHDIGIKNSEKKFGSSSGNYQQIEGPPEARKLLDSLNTDPALTERVCWLIARHHTYTDISGTDYQALVEADFLVNINEDGISADVIGRIYDGVFRTETGKKLLRALYAF